MRLLLVSITGLIYLITFLYEYQDLFLPKLNGNLSLFPKFLSCDTCGTVEKLKFLILHVLDIIISLCTDITSPLPAADFFLVLTGSYLLCFFTAFNPDRYTTSL